MDLRAQLREGNVVLEDLLASKNPKALRYTPRFVLSYLKRIIHLDEVNAAIKKYPHLKGAEFARVILDEIFHVSYESQGLDLIPKQGRYLFASNHPLGGLDGIVLIALVSDYMGKVYFPVNDLLTYLPQFNDTFLPINKHGSQSRENYRLLDNAYRSDAQILYFPAGLCSRKRKGKICDLTWHKSFVAKAIEYHRDVVPIFFSGRNSARFYNLARIRRFLGIKSNLEMLYLVDEMFKQRNANLHVKFGNPIPWQTFTDTRRTKKEWADEVKRQVYLLNDQLVKI